MPFTNLIIAGSSGLIANHLIPALLRNPTFTITILTRANTTNPPPSIPGAKVIPINYNDHSSLVKAITGADAIISLLSGTSSKDIDLKLLHAAQEARVRRIFPSEYTLDVLHPDAVSLLSDPKHWPQPASPVVTARTFAALAQDGPTSYTTIVPSAFIDGWLRGDFGLFDPKNRRVTLIDGGEEYFTGCSMGFLAEAVVAVLKMDEERTRNRRVCVAEVRTTMGEIARMYEDVMGEEVERVGVSSGELVERRDELLKMGDLVGAAFVGIQIGAFNGGGAGDLKDGMEFDGDGGLSVQRRSLRELVVEAVGMGG